MAFTHHSCPSSVCPSLYPYLKRVPYINSLVVPYNAHISLVIPKDARISLVIPKASHISLVIPKDANISLVIPKDAPISLVIPKIHISVIYVMRNAHIISDNHNQFIAQFNGVYLMYTKGACKNRRYADVWGWSTAAWLHDATEGGWASVDTIERRMHGGDWDEGDKGGGVDGRLTPLRSSEAAGVKMSPPRRMMAAETKR
ncbi:hypothetical protein E5676_scaffold575G00560 [Cucumis melo var. makuwa]|uniref:NBS-LRR type resistance protein n=1 Tax=Cucumis melo var. makuwa TaxID=1194695 RepID=A0A5A7SNX9_CUCMM|nr:hypothetical protein E6C27_scaffold708G00800 [Cucumis melo var. makuwa]TYK30380.1 hypothetical protein E5676_scaffold575G00560 [Cucumis melo var. makuwa]